VSRIGKQPIPVPSGVGVTIEGSKVTINGPKGALAHEFNEDMIIKLEGGVLTVARPSDERHHRSLHGLSRTLLSNMVTGVSEGFSKNLEIVGVGYRAEMVGSDLKMALGYSHPVLIKADGVTFEVPAPTKITVRGIDKQRVGQVAAEIRAWRKPEPYKGKGVRYEGEYVRRKLGKTAK
jgi:large subunit ribosomal protein L6